MYLTMGRTEIEKTWPTVCYTCPARTQTLDGPVCYEGNFKIANSDGSERNRPLYCPNGNGHTDSTNIKEIFRNNGRG